MTTIDSKPVQKLINDLDKENILFKLDDEETDVYGAYGDLLGRRKLENVIFYKNDIKLKIAFEIFFRQSGLSTIMELKPGNKKGEENFVKLHTISDDEFYLMQYYNIIDNINKKEIKWQQNKKS